MGEPRSEQAADATAKTAEIKKTEAVRPDLPPAARRALEEAEARRRAEATDQAADGDGSAREIGGRDGPEPTRYGDWEKKGLISDF
ncbi:MAG: DUF1674 domain-containing protein [Pseudomonadota bacterium]